MHTYVESINGLWRAKNFVLVLIRKTTLTILFICILCTQALRERVRWAIKWPWLWLRLRLCCSWLIKHVFVFKECQFCAELPGYSLINNLWQTSKYFQTLPSTSWSQRSLHFCSILKSLSSSVLSSCNIIIVNEDIRYQEPFCDIYVNT